MIRAIPEPPPITRMTNWKPPLGNWRARMPSAEEHSRRDGNELGGLSIMVGISVL